MVLASSAACYIPLVVSLVAALLFDGKMPSRES